MSKLEKIRKINLFQFIKLNYLSKQVERAKGSYLIPYKGSVIDLSKDARIEIQSGNLHFGSSRLRGSKTETFLRMTGSARWIVKNGASISYNATIEIKDKAVLESGFFFMNCGSVIICSEKISIGENVWMGRNNTVYDNDHHKIIDMEGNLKNKIRPVTIEDYVWITNHVSVLKGVTIGEGSVITPYSVIRSDVGRNMMVGQSSSQTVFVENVVWSPDLI